MAKLKYGEKNTCPCCDEYAHDSVEGSSDICPLCGWEDDGLQRKKQNYKPGANKLSLNEARAEWQVKTNRHAIPESQRVANSA